MPKLGGFELSSSHHVYASKSSRCCAPHLINNYHLLPKTIVNAKNNLTSDVKFLLHEVKELSNNLLALSEEFRSTSYLDFDDLSKTNEKCKARIDPNKSQFGYILEYSG